jgi:hypothetical protein
MELLLIHFVGDLSLTDKMMLVKFFVWWVVFIFKFIDYYITDKMTDIIKIIDDKFSDNHLPFMILLVNYFSIKSIFKYGQNNPTLLCNILVVILDQFWIFQSVNVEKWYDKYWLNYLV